MLEVSDETASVGESFVNVDCYLDSASDISAFYVKSLLFMFLPVFILLFPPIVILCWGAYEHWKKNKERGAVKHFMKIMYITTITVVLFLIHPNITMMKEYNCENSKLDIVQEYCDKGDLK